LTARRAAPIATTNFFTPDTLLNRILPLALALATLAGCRTVAVKTFSNALSNGGTSGETWTSEDDPELVADAVPFGLKTMESLLAENPKHEGLLGSLASGYTQYAYAFVLARAEAAELDGRSGEAEEQRTRAKRLFLRARDYGLRGLELRHAGLRDKLLGVREAGPAVAALAKDDVPLAYWTAASWALAISAAKGDMSLVAELPAPGALVTRSLALDEAWSEGALHEFLVSYAAARGDPATARKHYDRALELAKNKKVGPHVTLAESVLVAAQDRDGFTRLLEQVLAFDVDAPDARSNRLANVLAQRRAKLLLAHADDLFL
jgi:predicted anti-sigma-YlaC factor YlaD